MCCLEDTNYIYINIYIYANIYIYINPIGINPVIFLENDDVMFGVSNNQLRNGLGYLFSDLSSGCFFWGIGIGFLWKNKKTHQWMGCRCTPIPVSEMEKTRYNYMISLVFLDICR